MVLLNPAIEANEALQLKELVAETCFGGTAVLQVRLLHVLSSDADKATNKAFRLGQDGRCEFELASNRSWSGGSMTTEVVLQEADLDTITAGNFKPFQTGQLNRSAADPNESGPIYHASGRNRHVLGRC